MVATVMRIMYRRAIIAEIDFLFRETAKIRPASELHAATVDDQRLSGDEVTFDEIQQGARHVFWRPGRGDQAAVRTAVTALTCIVLRREYGSRCDAVQADGGRESACGDEREMHVCIIVGSVV